MQAPYELWLTQDFKRAVPKGHAEAYIVLARKGGFIPKHVLDSVVIDVQEPIENKAITPTKRKRGNRLG